jgi:hypothetical protein
MVAWRLVLSDLYNAMGVADVEQIDEAGSFRARYSQLEWGAVMSTWADVHCVDVSEETLT